MDPLHVAHLMVLGMWLGIVITEALFEFSGSDAESLRAAARSGLRRSLRQGRGTHAAVDANRSH